MSHCACGQRGVMRLTAFNRLRQIIDYRWYCYKCALLVEQKTGLRLSGNEETQT